MGLLGMSMLAKIGVSRAESELTDTSAVGVRIPTILCPIWHGTRMAVDRHV